MSQLLVSHRECRGLYGHRNRPSGWLARPPLRAASNVRSPFPDDVGARRQNAAEMLLEGRLMAVRNLLLTAIALVNLVFTRFLKI
jgi:hypothetical protein